MTNDDECISLFYTGDIQNNLRNKNNIFKKRPDVKDYLDNRFEDTSDTSEVLFRIKNKIEIAPKCKMCSNTVRYSKTRKYYSTYCCSKCQNSDPDKILKDKSTKLDRYGDPNYNNMDKQKETCLQKYGATSVLSLSETKEKIKNTNLQKYGVEYCLQSSEIIKKGQDTKLKIYGDKNFNNRKKAEQTTLDRYGVKNTKQAESSKSKDKETCLERYGVTSYTKTQEYKDRQKETFLKHFGVDNNTKSDEWKKKWFGNPNWVKNVVKHRVDSMRKNGSFNTSKPEKIIGDYLKLEYEDLILQYEDPVRYPFRCDFYIPSLDVFIEYDGHWTHGPHDFDPNVEEDLVLLERWKSSDGKYYSAAINTWTILDPQKRSFATKNDLNYIVLKYSDFKDLESIKRRVESFRNTENKK